MTTQSHSHRRQNLLTGEWVLVSPQRTQRPWQGQVEAPPSVQGAPYDPDCYLCPGNPRAGGMRNPGYSGPFAFDNDFPALSAESAARLHAHPLFRSQAESGCCRVVCYSEQHQLTLSRMPEKQASAALEFLFGQFRELDLRPDIGYVQMFENRGEMMGCSNPHPHAQIWATSGLPEEPAKELRRQDGHHRKHGSLLLLDYLDAELRDESRLVHVNDHWVSLVPFWALWPFETLLIPRRPMAAPIELGSRELAGMAAALQATMRAYDALFDTAMPYSMGFHPRPSDGRAHPEWQFHCHINPPLLRSATVRKHLVGFEMFGMPQRDLTPEAAAERLRSAIENHD